MKEAGKSTQNKTFSQREITKPQPPVVPQSSQSENVNTPKQKKEAEQMKEYKQTKTDEQQNPKKRREKRIPAEFKRLSNWREIMESNEEEIEKRRLERKQTNKLTKTIKHANKSDSELGKAKTSPKRTRKRNRKKQFHKR